VHHLNSSLPVFLRPAHLIEHQALSACRKRQANHMRRRNPCDEPRHARREMERTHSGLHDAKDTKYRKR